MGGWFLGALISLTALPRVPLDGELLTVVSVGVPIGLGIHLAWVHRDWSAHIETIGLATAAAGALAGANLLLIVLDIAGERSNRHRVAVATAPPAAP
ncbi:hypothetical protein B0I33_10690 [Prauserella shujinwangii]|uniref:Uncharacterized protein n=1 Tax=Prauserella shujinwangii TaxID=1453103 RepID=A0A2T0LTG9_9PSEU|nr:hypothetical protein [Prauserella shujinwangii]PRX46993.1 hypothetical protein B0I33_10690 [Prauserella shujinwangii]